MGQQTGRRRARASVPAQRHTSFGIVFERSANPMLLADDERRIVDANPAASRVLGYSRERLRELRIDDLLAPELISSIETWWVRFLKSGGHRGSLRFRLGSGDHVTAHMSSTADIEPGLHLSVLPAAGIELSRDGHGESSLPLSGELGRDLTERHVEVLTHLALGRHVNEIAEQLVISPETVRVHIRNARRRLGARTRTQAVALAIQRGVITP